MPASAAASSPSSKLATVTLRACCRIGSAAVTARADSRVGFQAISTRSSFAGAVAMCGSTMAGRPLAISTEETKSAGTSTSRFSSTPRWPSTSRSA